MLFEGVEMGDLKRLVEPNLTIDTYRSKMGDDKDICVLSFTIMGKEPAGDLVNFIEKSYDWVLDGDVSSGEQADGNYLVFVEVERNEKVCDHIVVMMKDLMNLTEQKIDDWTFTYYKGNNPYPLTVENLVKHVITSSEKYQQKMEEITKESVELDKLRAISGIKVGKKMVNDNDIRSIQIAAGIL